MQGFFELLTAAAILIWVLGPLARSQYEREQHAEALSANDDGDNLPPMARTDEPLASHPYFRPSKPRSGTMF